MTPDQIHSLLSKAYSGKNAKTITGSIASFSRHITHPWYEKSVRWCAQIMKRYGFDSVRVLSFPIDGKKLYGNWKSPRYWAVSRAYLKVYIDGQWRTMADYSKIATSLFVYAAPTNGEITGELALPDAPDLKGKLVFADPTSATYNAIAEGKALGIATDFAPNWPGVRSDQDFRNGRRWDNGFLFEDRKGLVGFSLSRNQGDLIRERLRQRGSLPCKFRVDGYLGKGRMYCATGCIKGSEKTGEEVVSVAHLYEVGANDNGSGVAASIECLRAIQQLIREKKLLQPKRTIRVVFAFEIIGMLAYFFGPGKKTRYVAGINPDMVGEDQKKCRSVLNIYQAPASNPEFANKLIIRLLSNSAGKKFRLGIHPFMVNDNVVTDPLIGATCPALIHIRDQFYHSNEDTINKVSEKTLHWVGSAMAAYLYATASLEQDDLDRFLGIVLPVAEKPIKPENALEKKAGQLVPRRTHVGGTFTFEHIAPEKRTSLKFHASWSPKWNLPVFWVNGKRSLLDIFRKASHESGPYKLEEFIEYFTFLAREKLIQLKIRQHTAKR